MTQAKMIEQNATLPQGQLQQLVDGGMVSHDTAELFSGKKTVLFAVPGAFTPTCSAAHLPGFVALADQIQAKGVDQIICLSVNDAFVMDAWGKAQNAEHIMMLADGDASFTKQMGLDVDSGAFGGVRSIRYAMIIEDNTVSQLFVDQPKTFELSTAENILKHL